MNTQAYWHPMIVHFPLALIVTAAVALLLARTMSGSIAATLAMVGTWNLCLGAVAALFAVGTGMAAVIDLHLGGGQCRRARAQGNDRKAGAGQD